MRTNAVAVGTWRTAKLWRAAVPLVAVAADRLPGKMPIAVVCQDCLGGGHR